MADVFDFELHEAHTDGNFDEDSDDVRKSCYLKKILNIPCLSYFFRFCFVDLIDKVFIFFETIYQNKKSTQ